MNENTNNPTKDFKKRGAKPTPSQFFSELGRIPPQALDFEEAVIGALMLEQNALSAVIDIIRPEYFYKDSHRRILDAIMRLFNQSEPVDLLTVTNELKKSGELDLVGGAYFLTSLTNRIASAANVEFHARIIVQKHILRELIQISSVITKEAFEDSTDVFNLLDKAQKLLFEISENNIRKGHDKMNNLISMAIEQIELARKKTDGLSGVPSGFSQLDRLTSGWQKSDLVILAARPGMGKTAFILSMARYMAVECKIGVAFFSLEMSALQLITRLISSETELPNDKLRKGSLEEHEWEQLQSKVAKLSDAPLYIDDTPALSIFELKAKCRRLKSQHDIQIIYIDYLQLMSTDGDNKGNREQEISTISRSLKSLAKELNVPVIALSQLSRAVETRGGNKRPMLSDLRESGAIEQDADMVLFIYRAEYYKILEDESGNSTMGTAEVIVAKHRNGALEDIKLRFQDRFAKFSDFLDEHITYQEIEPNTNFDNAPQTIRMSSKMNDDMDEPATNTSDNFDFLPKDDAPF